MTENNKNITSPTLVKGITRVGWFLNIAISALLINLIALYAIGVFIFLYVVLFIASKKDPDFLNIAAAKNIKIPGTKNINNFKGNVYVS